MRIVKQDEFDNVISNGTTLVDFYADWCGPCKKMGPLIEEIEKDFSNITFIKVNVDDANDIAARYGIMSIPTIILFKDGEVNKRSTGLLSINELKDFLNN